MTASEHPLTDLTVPKTQKAAVFEEWGKPVKIVERPVIQESQLKPGQVLVKIMYSGVCHTDLHFARADPSIMPPAPMVGGHEGAAESGFVVAIAPGTQSPVKIGQAVGVKWLASSCLSCEACARVQTGFGFDGTFQQYAVSYAAHVTPIPESVPLHLAAPILCAGLTVYKAIKEANTSPGDIVVIPGAGGGLGHLAIQYAVNGFGLRVIAVDTGDHKKELCLKLGAETFIDFKETDNIVEDVIRAADGAGVHAAIVTSGLTAVYSQSLQYLRRGGTLVAVGVSGKIEIDMASTIPRNIKIKTVYVGNREEARQALDMLARGRIQTTCRVEPLSKLPQVFDEMEEGKLAGRIVLDLWK
ncbi:Alcohol dehydrogenase GroES-like domain [Rhizoctonia solani]|uniref:alcohol dehydrogenase n=1 Tax=Rhizoctonia solani TaxID=456999 RepID=A0A8H7HDU7_9AGAM|nr:Alcohol dehydrogenase GroES-like domain [Rhizoctonia solani]